MRKEIMNKLKKDLGDASIDEVLRVLIEESSILEITACLDMIAKEQISARIAAFDWTGRIYPSGPEADLKIPEPPWKIKNQKAVTPDTNIEVLEPENDPEKEEADGESQ